MTTSHSPLRVLKAQADKIAKTIKAAERGDQVDARFAEKIATARRDNVGIKVGVVMDDKTIVLELPWETIRTTSEVGLAEYVLKLMRDARDQVH